MKLSLPATAAPVERLRGCCSPVAAPLAGERLRQQARLFACLADPARLEILHQLKAADGPVCVCDLTAVLRQAQPTISHHLARLREAGLVQSVRAGIWSFHSLRQDLPEATRRLVELLD
ncbi:MAG: ArsR/SmtB family transcription factor [Candidatus Dormibacteria bacterium]